MKSKLVDRLRDVNKNFLPILLENRANEIDKHLGLGTHFDDFLDKVKHSFRQNNEMICIVPTFYQLDDISPWKTKEFNYLKAYSLADKQTFQQILNTQVTLSRELNARFSNSVLEHLNSDGWNGRCTVMIRIVEDSEEVTLEYDDEFDLLKYYIGDGALKRIKEYVYSLFPEIPANFFTVFGNNNAGKIISLNFELKKSKKEIRELRTFINFSQNMKSEIPADSTIRSLQQALIEPVLQHSIFLQPGWELYYSFSNSVQYNKNRDNNKFENDYGLGGAFIIVDKEISLHDDFDRFIMLLERIVDKLANRVVNYYQIEKITDHAKASGVSAVMSRNMSHNIGSHVLSRLAKKNSREQLSNSDISFSKDDLANFGHFFSYLMRRMDFLADIATTVPVMTTTCEFVQDILNPFKNSIFIKKYITGNDLSFDIYPASKGLYVLIPNDILGKHAIYTIFENVIRNTAKHGNHKEDKFNIDITLSEDERNPDHVKVTIFDDCENKDVIKIVNDLNRKINLPLLDHDNTLRKEAWGMLEMKIAAAYLRKIPLNSIDDKKWDTTESNNKTASLLKAVVVDEGYLGYEFYLLRPKEGVIVHPDKVIKKTNFGEDIEKGSFDDYEELSGFSIIGYQQQSLSASDVTYFESNPGKFTRRLLRNFESGHDLTMSVETLWISWLQAAAKKKGVKNIIIHYESDETSATTIDSLNIAEEGRILNAVFVHHPKNELPAGDYVESITNKSQFYQFKNSVNTSKQFKFYLIEGILTNIILLDERIQEFTTESVLDDSIPINLQQYYERLGIFVPAREAIWLNDPYSADYREKVESWLKEHLSEADFFVVHIGVLEKLLQLSNYPDSEKIIQIEYFIQHLSKFLPDIFSKIVFISGRGRPDTIPAKYRFLNYSNIDQLLEKRICKATLTGLLYSARSYEEIT